uniref:BAR domain-containing protein n=1 Tax=Acrobeloides nanus TaxID=290746 RepID=A0A914DTM3_9BILA
MNIKRRLSKRSSDTVYSMEFSEKLKLIDATKKGTSDMIDELEKFIKGMNDNNAANRFEKPGEKCRAYARVCTDEAARAGFDTMKKVFGKIGRLHRLFSNEVKERCIVPMKEWLRADYKRMKAEVEKLNELRNAMDNASNESRHHPNNLILEQKHSEAEGAHQAQMGVMEERVFKKLYEDHEKLARIWKRFMEMEVNLYQEVRNCIEEAIINIQT